MSRKGLSKKRCYYCGAPCTSYEHVPPKQLFKGFPCDCITVPSCDIHNSEKGGRDSAVIKAMLKMSNNVANTYPPNSAVEKAINNAKPQFSQVKRQIKDVCIIEGYSPVVYIDDSVKTETWIKQLTAALFYDALREFDPNNEFDKAMVFSPGWFRGESKMEAFQKDETLELQKQINDKMQNLNWEKGWPSGKRNYPAEIYNFELSFDFCNEIIFRHQFLSAYTWYVLERTTNESREKIINRLGLK